MLKTLRASSRQHLLVVVVVELVIFWTFRLPLGPTELPWNGQLVDRRKPEDCGAGCASRKLFDLYLRDVNNPFTLTNFPQQHDSNPLLAKPGFANKTLILRPQGTVGDWLQTVAAAATISQKEQLAVEIVASAGIGSEIVWNDLFLSPKVYQGPGHRRLTSLSYQGDAMIGQPLKDSCMRMKSANWNDVSEKWKTVHQGQREMCLETRRLAKGEDDGAWQSETSWFYKMLSPVPAIQQTVAHIKADLQWSKYEWVGVHIEGTASRAPRDKVDIATGDKTNHPLQIKLKDMDSVMPLSDYIDQMKRMLKTMPNHDLEYWQAIKPVRFFLVTKSGNIRRAIHAAFRPGIVVDVAPDQLQSNHESLNPKQVDVMNLMLLASCRALIGTPFSPYSAAANLIGESFYVEPTIRKAVT